MPQEYNLVFQASDSVAMTLGDITAYDQVWNDFATAAGLNTSTDDGFSAWVSEVGSLAPDRLGRVCVSVSTRRVGGATPS